MKTKSIKSVTYEITDLSKEEFELIVTLLGCVTNPLLRALGIPLEKIDYDWGVLADQTEDTNRMLNLTDRFSFTIKENFTDHF